MYSRLIYHIQFVLCSCGLGMLSLCLHIIIFPFRNGKSPKFFAPAAQKHTARYARCWYSLEGAAGITYYTY